MNARTSVYMYMHIRIYTHDVYMQLFGKIMCICRIVYMQLFEIFEMCIFMFQGNIFSLFNSNVSENIRN